MVLEVQQRRAPAEENDTPLQQRVGERIRHARRQRGQSLAELGNDVLSRSFLSLVERGRSRISLRALELVADRLELPLGYFVDEQPDLSAFDPARVDHVKAAVAYSRLLASRGESAEAWRYALWAAEANLRQLAQTSE
jgi:transcriptional regulator with XRE-family HTH domain